MTIKNKFDIGQEIYLVTDPEQHRRLITSFMIYPGISIVYNVSWCGEVTEHYDFELNAEKQLQL